MFAARTQFLAEGGEGGTMPVAATPRDGGGVSGGGDAEDANGDVWSRFDMRVLLPPLPLGSTAADKVSVPASSRADTLAPASLRPALVLKPGHGVCDMLHFSTISWARWSC